MPRFRFLEPLSLGLALCGFVAWRAGTCGFGICRELASSDPTAFVRFLDEPLEKRVGASLRGALSSLPPAADAEAERRRNGLGLRAWKFLSEEVPADAAVFVAMPTEPNEIAEATVLFPRLQTLLYPRVVRVLRIPKPDWKPPAAGYERSTFVFAFSAPAGVDWFARTRPTARSGELQLWRCDA